MKKKTTERKFMLYTGQKMEASSFAEDRILLYPFRNLSVQPFFFPFSGMSRVRDALKIQLHPLLGEKTEDVSLVPLLTKTGKKASEGTIFLLYGEDSGGAEGSTDKIAKDYAVWPVPLVFAAEINGSGLIIWEDDDQIISLWLQDWVPMLYRWSARSQNTVDEEKELMSAYADQRGESLGEVFVVGGEEKGAVDIQRHGMRTIQAYPAYEHLDLSNRGADLLEQREKTVGQFIKMARLAVASGLIFAVISGGLFWQRSSLQEASSSLPEDTYSTAFGERSRQPLVSIKGKLSSLQSGKQDASLQGFLRTLGPVWEELAGVGDIAIETMRYSNEKTDLIGTAKDNGAIQRLRALLEERGFSPKTDNIQQVPGGSLRFSLSIIKGVTS